jgi:hypothetical protein
MKEWGFRVSVGGRREDKDDEVYIKHANARWRDDDN